MLIGVVILRGSLGDCGYVSDIRLCYLFLYKANFSGLGSTEKCSILDCKILRMSVQCWSFYSTDILLNIVSCCSRVLLERLYVCVKLGSLAFILRESLGLLLFDVVTINLGD